MRRSPLRVSLPVFPECDPSVIYGVFDTLWCAGRLWPTLHGRPAGDPLFTPRLVGRAAGPLELVTGVKVVLQDRILDVPETDVVFVPNVMVDTLEALGRLDPVLIDWIRARYEAGAHLYAVCGGALVLGSAGLLDGLDSTTHWAYAPLMRRAFPRVNVCESRILVQAGPGHRIVCAGGATSWQDLCLMLIARHAGSAEAMKVSKIFLYQWHREGQLPFATLIENTSHGDSVVRRVQRWLSDNYRRHDALLHALRRSGLPKRTFDRRFKQAVGQAPLSYVQALRIEEAKHRLESSAAPVEAIAAEVGYSDTRYFRRLFVRLTGMHPSAYRRQFQLPAIDAGESARESARAAPFSPGASQQSNRSAPGSL